VAVVAALVGGTSLLSAQGVTTGAIAGQVTDEAGRPLSEVQIVIKNVASGFQTGSFTRNDGRYRVQNLESGGPYTVTARRIGLQARTESNQIVPLAQTLVIDFKLTTAAAQLAGVQIVATATPDVFTPSNQGTKTLVSDTVIQRMPTLTRNLTDFIRLTPQASATGAGFSGGGMSNRMNNVQIDGASERDVFGLGATGQPGAEVNAKSVSIEAVKEFQVLLAPFDVRQGNFGGLLLNAVTKGGTNDWHGSVFHYFRNQDYGADTPAVRGTKFNRAQTGFSLGGPIIRDKLHFFVAPEFQKENSPVTGPYLSQPTSFAQKFPIQPETIARFESIMASLGDKSLGSSGYINVPNPLSNVFGRLDYQINDANRLVFRYNYSKGERLRLQNNRGTTTAVYSDNFHNFVNVKNAPVAQLFSNFNSGASNELFVGYNNWYNRRTPLSLFPQITINNVSANGPNGNSRIIAGADQFSQGNELDTKTWEVTENFTFRPMGKHTITVGTRGEYVWLRNLFTQSSYGVWGFRNLDSLAAKTRPVSVKRSS
jgi:outer membrane receptor for ferrienterochelin and colicin